MSGGGNHGAAVASAKPNSRRVALVLLCGAPASGKSTLARELVGLLNGSEEVDNGTMEWKRSLVSALDNIVHTSDSATAIDTVTRRGARDGVCASYQSFDELFATEMFQHRQAGKAVGWNDAYVGVWRQCQRKLFTIVCAEMATVLDNVGNDADDTMFRIVIVEDNFAYRSMRKRYARVCAHLGVAYVQVFTLAQLDTLLRRNYGRNSGIGGDAEERSVASLRVPDSVVVNIHSQLEVGIASGVRAQNVGEAVAQCRELHWNERSVLLHTAVTSPLHALVALQPFHFAALLATPLRMPPSNGGVGGVGFEEREADRAITRSNPSHNLDIALRQEVGRYMAALKARQLCAASTMAHGGDGGSGSDGGAIVDMRTAAERVGALRRAMLADFAKAHGNGGTLDDVEMQRTAFKMALLNL